jgi:hypothetical protein
MSDLPFESARLPFVSFSLRCTKVADRFISHRFRHYLRRLRGTGGNSSSGIGGTSGASARMASNLSGEPSAPACCLSQPTVRRAAIFSATADTMKLLTEAPSAAASCFAWPWTELGNLRVMARKGGKGMLLGSAGYISPTFLRLLGPVSTNANAASFGHNNFPFQGKIGELAYGSIKQCRDD